MSALLFLAASFITGLYIGSLRSKIRRLEDQIASDQRSLYPKRNEVTDAWNIGGSTVWRLKTGHLYMHPVKRSFSEEEFRQNANYFLKILGDIKRDRAAIEADKGLNQ